MKVEIWVAIPFKSGLAVIGFDDVGRSRKRVAIPFKSGLAVIVVGWRSTKMYSVAIPFKSGLAVIVVQVWKEFVG